MTLTLLACLVTAAAATDAVTAVILLDYETSVFVRLFVLFCFVWCVCGLCVRTAPTTPPNQCRVVVVCLCVCVVVWFGRVFDCSCCVACRFIVLLFNVSGGSRKSSGKPERRVLQCVRFLRLFARIHGFASLVEAAVIENDGQDTHYENNNTEPENCISVWTIVLFFWLLFIERWKEGKSVVHLEPVNIQPCDWWGREVRARKHSSRDVSCLCSLSK